MKLLGVLLLLLLGAGFQNTRGFEHGSRSLLAKYKYVLSNNSINMHLIAMSMVECRCLGAKKARQYKGKELGDMLALTYDNSLKELKGKCCDYCAAIRGAVKYNLLLHRRLPGCYCYGKSAKMVNCKAKDRPCSGVASSDPNRYYAGKLKRK